MDGLTTKENLEEILISDDPSSYDEPNEFCIMNFALRTSLRRVLKIHVVGNEEIE
jgi:hypothetical protein